MKANSKPTTEIKQEIINRHCEEVGQLRRRMPSGVDYLADASSAWLEFMEETKRLEECQKLEVERYFQLYSRKKP